MEFNNEAFLKDRDQSKQEHDEPKAWHVEDDTNLKENDLKKTLSVNSTEPKPEKVERGNGENDRPQKGDTYRERTADNDEPNIPGPNEVPDQQKVGEDADNEGKEHIET
jgi:hypothetical protein